MVHLARTVFRAFPEEQEQRDSWAMMGPEEVLVTLETLETMAKMVTKAPLEIG